MSRDELISIAGPRDGTRLAPHAPTGHGPAKTPTGIRGLDEITRGGLPKGRPTLVCGGPGSGKTLLALTFLVNGALHFDEPGVLMTFEENEEEIGLDVESLGFDLPALIAAQKLVVDYVRVERGEIEETGEYDLEGLFVRLDHAIRAVGARRVVLDTVESLFAGLKNDTILRAELRRLFRWLKDQGVTTLVTGERGEGLLTRQGLEEYVSDAVILLDHRVHDQVSTRRLRVVKYRGSYHGTNEYPFLINADGISVLPVSSLGLEHRAPLERVSSGVSRLDDMLSGEGYYRGSTVLVSGTAGTGKTSLAAHFLDAACRRGERSLCFLFEESPQQLLRNMRSIGLDLEPWVAAGLLQFHADRPSRYGLETHLVTMHEVIAQFCPAVTVIDPVTNLMTVGTYADVQAMLTRLIDHLKTENITALLTSLLPGQTAIERTETTISSLMDTWIVLANDQVGDRHRRGLYVLKSRGMAHSNELCEFMLTDHGLDLVDGCGDEQRMSGDVGRGSRKGRITMQLFEGGITVPPPPGKAFSLRLYVAGQTPKSVLAFRNLKQICEEHLQGRYEIEIIDLLENPQLARGDQILAVPTLVRRLPEPIKKIIGDLSNTQRVLVGLDLRARG